MNFASFLENIIFIDGCANKDWQMLLFCENAYQELNHSVRMLLLIKEN
ncbi:hypothetical protein [Coprobacillus cateniformis]|jgi:hypothetical protein|nr:hypothetical protein [Coprobacillus cateniformis]